MAASPPPVRDITIVIKTFERPQSLRALLESINVFYPELPVIVVDDSRQALPRTGFDSRVRYVHTEFDIGLSEGRNRGVALADTEFVFVMDDDFIFTPQSRLEWLKQPLVEAGFSIAGSRMINFGREEVVFHGSFELQGRSLRLVRERAKGQQGGFPVFDFCHNVLMAPTDFLRAHPWSPELKLQEHWDFFYRIAQAGAGAVTARLDTSFDHYPIRCSGYRRFRFRATDYLEMARKKHGLADVLHVDSARMELLKAHRRNRRVDRRVLASLRRGAAVLGLF